MNGSALYAGRVVHVRIKPLRHRLAYRLFYLLLDLDELPALSRRLFCLGHNRPGLLGVHDRDHGDGSARPLKQQIEALLAAAGLDQAGRVRMLTMPRVLGRVFNPITVYFCDDRAGRLQAMLYEVNNTFGQRHSYLIPAISGPAGHAGAAVIDQRCDKDFYVSPFMDMALRYHFRLTPPDTRLALAIEAADHDGAVLYAAFNGRRRALTDAALLSMLLRFPLLALQVLGGIHWEALKLWLKGLKLRPRPEAPQTTVSITHRQTLV